MNTDNLVSDIKTELVDYYDYDNWDDFVDDQEMGDCQSICYFIMKSTIDKSMDISHHFGEIEIDDNIYNIYNVKYDEHINILTHHWISINGGICEFSKGTLKNHIDYDDVYCVTDVDDWRYKSIRQY